MNRAAVLRPAGWAVALVAAALAACNGSGGDAVPERQALAAADGAAAGVAGRLVPALADVIVVELDAAGVERQRSAPSDAEGGFRFARPLSGLRVQTLAEGSTLRLPAWRSARVPAAGQALELTPATTLHDQWLQDGASEAEARARLARLVAPACGTEMAQALDVSLRGRRPLEGATREPALLALDAYLGALRSIGYGPPQAASTWTALALRHQPVLQRLCGTARELTSPAWQQAAAGAAVGSARADGVARTLALTGLAMVAAEYPRMGPWVERRLAAWAGREAALALGLAGAAAEAWRGRPAETGPDDVAAQRLPTLDPAGRIVTELRATVRPVGVPTVRVQNLARNPRTVQLSLNGAALADFDGTVADVLALPASRGDESLHERAWRYLVERRRHKDPLTGGMFFHQADLYLRSAGSGYCDDVSGVLLWLWQGLGYEARVIGLTGHVVPEVKVGERWEMYDPDYGVYFFNRDGLIASVDDIAADTTLLTQPLVPTLPPDAEAYSAMIAGFYGSTEDNFLHEQYSVPIVDPLGNRFTIPSRGYLEIVGGPTYIMPAAVPGTTVDLAPARLWFPPGFSGDVELPLIAADVGGTGRVTMLGREFELAEGTAQQAILDHYLAAPDVGVKHLRIDRADADGVTVTMLVNPMFFQSTGTFTVGLTGSDVSGLVVRNVRRP